MTSPRETNNSAKLYFEVTFSLTSPSKIVKSPLLSIPLGRRAMGHFVALIEVYVHLIRVNPGHNCFGHQPPEEFFIAFSWPLNNLCRD